MTATPTGVGVRLGVDVGTVRVGVAVGDPHGILATPVATLNRDVAGGTDLAALADLVTEREVVEVVVGLPRTLRGTDGPAAAAARAYAAQLAALIDPVPIVFSDERMSSVVANRTLSDRGIKGARRKTVVDQAAAVAILQGHLDRIRSGR